MDLETSFKSLRCGIFLNSPLFRSSETSYGSPSSMVSDSFLRQFPLVSSCFAAPSEFKVCSASLCLLPPHKSSRNDSKLSSPLRDILDYIWDKGTIKRFNLNCWGLSRREFVEIWAAGQRYLSTHSRPRASHFHVSWMVIPVSPGNNDFFKTVWRPTTKWLNFCILGSRDKCQNSCSCHCCLRHETENAVTCNLTPKLPNCFSFD